MSFPFKLTPPPAPNAPTHKDPSDERLGQIVEVPESESEITKGSTVIMSFPCDLGVRLNHGRAGAHRAAVEIRRVFYPMLGNCGAKGAILGRGKIFDIGSTEVLGENLADDQAKLGQAAAYFLERGCFLAILGGGHETTYGHFLGYANTGRNVSIINIDAHHDVREADGPTSGTPFRQALEHGGGFLQSYQIIGAQPQCFSSKYLSYLKTKNADVHWRDEVRTEGPRSVAQRALANVPEGSDILLTLDMDAVDQSAAPGVSAPCADGLTSFELFPLLHELVNDPRVSSFDVVEVNPEFDLDNQTARLAALALHRVLSRKDHRE